ncbi:hypothetical protein OHB26_25180 [Nocardia sp. NBC_01503]|uniref:hypothetical protein n=1 Tax=Nocardia sp. NBC_01503 TaxID=2975997 RepID=UPI002E7BB9F7|nr:hypothetical protein [Nocardia sp. NBC_01503]WTL30227.1 hypothetical protein OHB26_25180 [Nocardia sp. NBC_01503]
MPNLDFYAVDEDWSDVLEVVFELGLFRVFESYSEPGHELREFSAAVEIPDNLLGRHLMLFVAGAGPEPFARRIDFASDVVSDNPFRYTCEGWGLIQLHYGGPWGDHELRWTHTNHNTAKRAAVWSATLPRLGEPAAWDWAAIAKASSRLNRVIQRKAVGKIGSHPVLPYAQRFIADGGLQYEYGMGVHATPAAGMSIG